jgi:hypothetical protein
MVRLQPAIRAPARDSGNVAMKIAPATVSPPQATPGRTHALLD